MAITALAVIVMAAAVCAMPANGAKGGTELDAMPDDTGYAPELVVDVPVTGATNPCFLPLRIFFVPTMRAP